MFIFKYCCDLIGIKILQNLQLKVTPPKEFDDPFEMSPIVRLSDKKAYAIKQTQKDLADPAFLDRLKCEHPDCMNLPNLQEKLLSNEAAVHAANFFEKAWPQFAIDFQKTVPDLLSSRLGVICFSSDPVQPLMWAHYGAKHRGMIIEFDDKDELFHSDDFQVVEYSEQRAEFDPSSESDDSQMKALVKRKSPHWEYQRESRLIVSLKDTVQTENKDIFMFPIRSNIIKSVTLGLRIDPKKQVEVESTLKQPHLSHVKLWKIEADDNKFILCRKPAN